MRLFVALEPTPDFRSALALAQDRLRLLGVTGRYMAPDNLHLTLAFIGEWPEAVTEYLPPVAAPFPVALSGFGIFPEAKVLWAGTAPSEALERLAADVRRTLTEAGIPFDPKPFCPHITLIRKPVVPEGVRLPEIAVPQAGMTVSRVCLYRSHREESGMMYTVIGRGPAAPRKEEEA